MTDPNFPRQRQAKRLSPEEAQSIFAQANKLTRLRQYEEAIPILELFCTQTDETYPNHYQAKMLLVKAYQHHHSLEQAIALCQELLNSDHTVAQLWARSYLPTIAPEPVKSEPEQAEVQEKDWRLPKRSLQDFKEFCRQYLVAYLQEVEKTRKAVIQPLQIVTVMLAFVIGLVVRFTPAALDNAIVSSQRYCAPVVQTAPTRQSDKEKINIGEATNDFVAKLDGYSRQSVKRCKNDFIPLWLQNGVRIMSFALLVVGVACFLWVAFYTSSTEAYGRGFQRAIIESIIYFLDPQENLNYFRGSNDAAVLSALQQSRLFNGIGKSVYMKQDHCVAGKLGQISLFFSEVTFQKELPHTWITQGYDFLCGLGRPGGSIFSISTLIFLLLSIVRGTPYCLGRIAKGQRIDFEHFRTEIVLNAVSRQPIFKGMFFISDFNKSFRGKTIILPNNLISKVKFLNQHHGQSVKLEDPEFNKFFSVYSNDQVGARYVLSTSMMRRIVDFRKKANRDILISLVDSQLYVGVPSEEDLFEPRLFKTMLSFNPMREYFEMLQLMMSIVEDLNLNQRIWKL
ncbi:DUF3137 domain-containing protein [Leptolyngbya sp. AN03gr2]|uniref:DUF3137 domain-containing protein n=1 Tax=unclassified Leptolyngbya TaxID=2650499 RepID=UPI003D30F960